MRSLLSVAALGLAWMGSAPLLVSAARGVSPTQGSGQLMQIEVRGAAALVTVTRTLPGSATAGATREDVLDLALPPEAQLVDVAVDTGAGHFEAPAPAQATRARDGYLEAARALGVTARALPYDDDTTTRIRVTSRQQKPNRPATIRYRFSTLLHIAGRRAELTFPGSPESSPVPTRVTVRADAGQDVADITIAGAPHPIARGSPVTATEAEVSTAHRWLVSLGLGREVPGAGTAATTMMTANGAASTAARAASPSSRLTALAARGPIAPTGTGTRIAYAVGLAPAPPQALPERVLFLIDRSRSVGPGGLELEREVARRILMALPPSTEFNALFFDRTQTRLFPLSRGATRQALGALEDEMVPARLANGTDLRGALRAAGEVLRREAAAFAPRALVVILTDGAVGRLAPTADGTTSRGTDAVDPLGSHPGVDLMLAALSVRSNDDRAVSPDERRGLRQIAAGARLGAVERELRASGLEDGVPAALDALRTGGDVFSVRLGTRDAVKTVAGSIGPGDGAAAVVSLDGKPAQLVNASMTALSGAETRGVPMHMVTVEPRWLPTAREEPAGSETRVLIGPALAVLVEAVAHPESPDEAAAGPSGYLERSVVRDALSLAFTPRARACYLSRTGSTPADHKLSGRVRLALELVRGEVGGARVESSTLGHPGIESCLREAAFALEIPRAYRNDEPVTAVLNLVFRPHTPERPSATQDPDVSREIDLLVEGALKTGAQVSAPPAARDGGPD